MILGPLFEQFVNESPRSVMSRATIASALPASFRDGLFERTAESGYTKELLFSTTVAVMSLVTCGRVPHVQSAYPRRREHVPVAGVSEGACAPLVRDHEQHIGPPLLLRRSPDAAQHHCHHSPAYLALSLHAALTHRARRQFHHVSAPSPAVTNPTK